MKLSKSLLYSLQDEQNLCHSLVVLGLYIVLATGNDHSGTTQHVGGQDMGLGDTPSSKAAPSHWALRSYGRRTVSLVFFCFCNVLVTTTPNFQHLFTFTKLVCGNSTVSRVSKDARTYIVHVSSNLKTHKTAKLALCLTITYHPVSQQLLDYEHVWEINSQQNLY